MSSKKESQLSSSEKLRKEEEEVSFVDDVNTRIARIGDKHLRNLLFDIFRGKEKNPDKSGDE